MSSEQELRCYGMIDWEHIAPRLNGFNDLLEGTQLGELSKKLGADGRFWLHNIQDGHTETISSASLWQVPQALACVNAGP